jgi:hypothetical protein
VDDACDGVLINSDPKRLLKILVPTPAGEAAWTGVEVLGCCCAMIWAKALSMG